jgi:predicted SAM-dependent methyltransferase
MRLINLGCGRKKYEGYINIDANPNAQPDILRDIEKGLPFDDNSVDYIISEHFLEHVNPDNLHFVMREIWRVLKFGCHAQIKVPIGKGWTHSPEHKTHFEDTSWVFFTIWNRFEDTGYKFKLTSAQVIRAGVNEIEQYTDSTGCGDELIMTLEAVLK